MQVKCANQHTWDRLPNFPDTKCCPECGLEASTDYAAMGAPYIKGGCDQDWERLSPQERQFWMENRRTQEHFILSGQRGRGSVEVIERGPDWSRPFGNDPMARREAIERHGYSKEGY